MGVLNRLTMVDPFIGPEKKQRKILEALWILCHVWIDPAWNGRGGFLALEALRSLRVPSVATLGRCSCDVLGRRNLS